MAQIRHVREHPRMVRKLIKVCPVHSICLVYFILNQTLSSALKSFWCCALGKLLRLVLRVMASRGGSLICKIFLVGCGPVSKNWLSALGLVLG